MKDNKRNLASIVVSKMTKPEHSEAEKPEEFDELQAAAEEVLSAIEAKDSGQLKTALKSMIQMCMDSYEAEEEAAEEYPELGE